MIRNIFPNQPVPTVAPWQCQGQRGQVSAPRCCLSCSTAGWPQWAAGRVPGLSHEILMGLQIKELCNSVTRKVMQSEGCLEVFQNTAFNTVKKSKREDTGQTALTSSPTLQADNCCWGVFHILSLICPIMKEQLPHTFSADAVREVTEVTLHLPAGVLPRLRQFLDY